MTIQRVFLATILASLILVATNLAGQAAGDCAALRDACRAAGFSARGDENDDSVGTANVPQCIRDLVTNKLVDEKTLMPLPDVPTETIAACRIERSSKRIARMDRQTPESATVPTMPVESDVTGPRANIIFILADDFSWNLMPETGGDVAKSMPNLAALQADGATFDNYFVTNSLCCPSRSAILTGLMPHNNGVLTNRSPDGGYETFMDRGNAERSIAVAFAAGGFRTAMLGKYLNRYQPEEHGAGPGWSDWMVAGAGYSVYSTIVNTDGKLSFEEGYLTDLMAERAAEILDSARQNGQPAMLYIAPFTPHSPYVPPDRYKALYPDLTYPRGPAYRVEPDDAAPAWLKDVPPLPDTADGTIDAVYRARVRSDKAIDDMIGALRQKLEEDGLADSTYVIFSSDNGYHLGEYALFAGKMTPYDIDTRVPLVIAGPGIPKGQRIPQVAMNIDLFPTFANLAGLPPPAGVDGVSLVSLLVGQPVPSWRNMAVIEHEKTNDQTADVDKPDFGRAYPDTYVALRLPSELYVEYTETGERSYYDLATDPSALHNIYDTLPEERKQALAEAVAANHACAGEGVCWSAQHMQP